VGGLITPGRPPPHIERRVAIAWKGTARGGAWRCLCAAVAGRRGAGHHRRGRGGAGTTHEACERLRQALIWHNTTTIVRHVRPSGRELAEALLTAVGAQNADLLVMGGYGHSRLREVVFGGVTPQRTAGVRCAVADDPLNRTLRMTRKDPRSASTRGAES
jgi:hypothetical protein